MEEDSEQMYQVRPTHPPREHMEDSACTRTSPGGKAFAGRASAFLKRPMVTLLCKTEITVRNSTRNDILRFSGDDGIPG